MNKNKETPQNISLITIIKGTSPREWIIFAAAAVLVMGLLYGLAMHANRAVDARAAAEGVAQNH